MLAMPKAAPRSSASMYSMRSVYAATPPAASPRRRRARDRRLPQLVRVEVVGVEFDRELDAVVAVILDFLAPVVARDDQHRQGALRIGAVLPFAAPRPF